MPNFLDIIINESPTYIDITNVSATIIDVVVNDSSPSSGGGLFEERVINAVGLNYTIQSSGYTTANISQVFVDGILMIPEDDYVITNATLITFTTSITGSNLQIFYGKIGVFIP